MSTVSRSSSHPPSVATIQSLPERAEGRLEEAEGRSLSCSEPGAPGVGREKRSPNDMLPQELLDTNKVEGLTKLLSRYRTTYGHSSQQVAHVYNFLGNAHFRRCEYQLAVEAYKQAIQCAPGSHLGDSYANLGTVYWTIGELDEAVAFLKRAQDVHEYTAITRNEDPRDCLSIAAVAYQLGIVFTLKSSFHKALRQFSTCQDIRERVLPPDHVDIARVLDATGRVYALRNLPGDLRRALRYHEEAFQIKHSLPKRQRDPALLATTLQSIAHLHIELGDTDAAIYSHKLLLKTLKKLRPTGTKSPMNLHKDIQATYNTLWRLYKLVEDTDLAERIYQEASQYSSLASSNTDRSA